MNKQMYSKTSTTNWDHANQTKYQEFKKNNLDKKEEVRFHFHIVDKVLTLVRPDKGSVPNGFTENLWRNQKILEHPYPRVLSFFFVLSLLIEKALAYSFNK
jgi:hypothetical protein